MVPVTPWLHDRPVRNRNPGDLRPRTHQPVWPGQDDIDTGPGGPFSIFATNADGWCALGLWCLDARYMRGLTTASQMIGVFAPPTENDTTHYAETVVARIGDGPLDLTNRLCLELLCKAIVHYEDARAIWPEPETLGGLHLATMHWPAFKLARTRLLNMVPLPPAHPAHPPGPVTPAARAASMVTADALNEAELERIREVDTTDALNEAELQKITAKGASA